MINSFIKQIKPSEVYDNWEKTVESLRTLANNTAINAFSIPSWADNLSIDQFRKTIDYLIKETDLNYTLSMISSIEGLFNHQLKYIIAKKSKDKLSKVIRSKFRLKSLKTDRISFDNMLDVWKNVDHRIKNHVSRLKTLLQYRHWLAHGRHWSIHYRNIPDPRDVFLLYDSLNQLIGFDLSF